MALTRPPTKRAEERVLVTGAAGFFGRAIVRALTVDGFRVCGTDRVDESEFRPRLGTAAALVDYVPRDVQTESLEDLVDRSAAVVYAAALTPADEREGDTADRLLDVNLRGFFDLLEAVRRSDCRRVVFVSSSGVYDQATSRTLREEDADGGTSLYGAAKLAAEIISRRLSDLFAFEFCALRPTSLIGPGEVERSSRPRVTPFLQLVRAALAKREVQLDGAEFRADWLAVDDAAEAVSLMLSMPKLSGGSFNLSSGQPRRFREVADAVDRVIGLRLGQQGEAIGPGVDRRAVISNERLVALGWRPRRSLDDVVRDVAADLQGTDC